MEQSTIVTRFVNIEMSPDEVWFLLSDGRGWSDWMVDDAAVIVEPGAEGTVTDGDRTREVRVTEVVERERVSFDWWPSDDEGAVSTVELVVAPGSEGTLVRIVETFPARTIVAARASAAWAVRATCLRACSRFVVAA